MANKFEQAQDEVYDLVEQTVKSFHPDHLAAGTTFEVCLGFAPIDAEGNRTGTALKENGYPTNGNARICGLKERVFGRADAELTLDGDTFYDLSSEQQAAVVDHEIYKLEVRRNVEGEILFDNAGRPKLMKRQYDVRVGWFSVIAERHGPASSEVTQAQDLFRSKEGQLLFPFVSNKRAKRLQQAQETEIVG